MKTGGKRLAWQFRVKDPKEKGLLSFFGLTPEMTNGPVVSLIFKEGQRCQKCLS